MFPLSMLDHVDLDLLVALSQPHKLTYKSLPSLYTISSDAFTDTSTLIIIENL